MTLISLIKTIVLGVSLLFFAISLGIELGVAADMETMSTVESASRP